MRTRAQSSELTPDACIASTSLPAPARNPDVTSRSASPSSRSVPASMSRPGDALMLYTDGLIEAPGLDIDSGTDRLLGEADRLVTSGFRAGAGRLVDAMQASGVSSDDCALVLIWRS